MYARVTSQSGKGFKQAVRIVTFIVHEDRGS
jgi:hypothetical protein